MKQADAPVSNIKVQESVSNLIASFILSDVNAQTLLCKNEEFKVSFEFCNVLFNLDFKYLWRNRINPARFACSLTDLGKIICAKDFGFSGILSFRRCSIFNCEFSLMFSLELQLLKGSFANRRLLE